MAMLDQIVTMCESAVPFQTPQTKQQSEQWLEKCTQGRSRQSPCDQDQANGPVLLQQEGPSSLHKLCAQGDHSECQVHREGPGQVSEDFQSEKAINGSRGLVVPQYSGAHCRHGDRMDGGQVVPGLRAPTLLTGSHPSQLLPLSLGDRELASLTLTQETFKKEQEGAIRTLKDADFAIAFRQWYER
jgi:hypothetical protein